MGIIGFGFGAVALGGVLIMAMWLPFMIQSGASKAEVRAQDAIQKASLAQYEVEQVRRELDKLKEVSK